MKKNENTNLEQTIGYILRTNPEALQGYVDALYRDFLIEKFYSLLMKKQRLLNVYIAPEVVARAMQRVLFEEMKNGALKKQTEHTQSPKIIFQTSCKTIIFKKKEENTR